MSVFKRTIKTKQGKSHYWYIDYTVNNKRKWESVGRVGEATKADARKLLALRRTEILQGKFKTPDKRVVPTFAEFAMEYLEYAKGNKKSWDRDMYSIRKMSPYFNNEKLTDITPILIEKYKLSRKQVVQTQTINKDLSILRRVFNVAISWNKCDSNPLDDVKFFPEAEPKDRVLSCEEEVRLLKASPNHVQPILITALNTGMRYRELLKLRWQDVNLDSGYINIETSKSGKGRNIPINGCLEDTLKSLKSRYFVSTSVSTRLSDVEKTNDSSALGGRHAVLRGLCLRACGFDSRLRHHTIRGYQENSICRCCYSNLC